MRFRREHIAIIVAGLAFLAFLFIALNRNEQPSDVVPDEGVGINLNNQAVITDQEAIFDYLGSVNSLEQLQEDMYYFGRSLDKTVEYVVFHTTSTNIEDEGIVITGSYSFLDEEIRATVTKQNNSRINTSIVNTVSNFSIDSELPSNSSRNILIAQLPITESDYKVDYEPVSNTFIITAYPSSDPPSSIIERAVTRLRENIPYLTQDSYKTIVHFPTQF